ncbi:MAG: class I SAM-dependent RNA methyltransferase [Caulobacterales bacterium]|nr:class I SAM-dependent RNA methyltransferase [Caulobacterales bacterium]
MREFEILEVGARGDGVGGGHAGGRVYVPLTLAHERVSASVEGDRGELLEVLTASPERVLPPCPHFGACGGCAFQHWSLEGQFAWKSDQVRAALAREGLETDIRAVISTPPGARRRVALHARPGREGSARLGFKGRRSWALTEIETCLVADPRIVAALPGLRILASAFLDHPKSAPTLKVTVTETGLDVEVTGVERKSGDLPVDRRVQAAEAAAELDLARLTLGGELIYQARKPWVRIGPAQVEPPAGAFLQAAPQAEAAMQAACLEAVQGAGRAADLFCGLGAFALPMATQVPVLAADSAGESIEAMKQAAARTPGLKTLEAQTRDLFREPVSAMELKGCDVIVFDPPRAGGLEQARQIAASDAARVVGISCNPTTFSRDARVLVDAGWRLEHVTPVDQFLWSSHIELIGVFSR